MHRFLHAVRFGFSRNAGPRNHLLARFLFLRGLGFVYLSAFIALALQAPGLIGSHGILPAAEYLQALHRLGPLRFWYAPSLFAIHPTDAFLQMLLWAGVLASALVISNVLPRAALLVCFVCFLSFVGVSQDFGQYQSDGMLLEAGFLSLFVAPRGFRPGLGRNSLPVRAAMFLLLWEWFRIYFQSGCVKLLSGDRTWRDLTAMYEYYQNGPLPTWVGWYLGHLPNLFHRSTAALTLLMELLLVFMAFLPRRWRIACFWIVTLWQAGVILTANYAFLNYLVLLLGFLLLDDRYLAQFVPRRWRAQLFLADGRTLLHDDPRPQPHPAPQETALMAALQATLQTATACLLLTWVGYTTLAQTILMFAPAAPLPAFPISLLEPFRIANSYGLFAVMTPHRFEIEFQGSDDGRTWTPYSFRFKPQDPSERPRIYAPYQPRFDWNLWFASLAPWQQSPIVPLTEERLLDGDGAVLGLFRSNPFPSHPPRYVRAVLWQYWFSSWQEHRTHHLWWRRRWLGTFAPTIEKLPDGRYGAVVAPDLAGPPQD